MATVSGAPFAALLRPGDTAHVEVVDAGGFTWSYPSRVVWTGPQRLALTLPSDSRWLPLLVAGRPLTVTVLCGEAAATAVMRVQGISQDPPPLLLVGPARAERRQTRSLTAGDLPRLPAGGESP